METAILTAFDLLSTSKTVMYEGAVADGTISQ